MLHGAKLHGAKLPPQRSWDMLLGRSFTDLVCSNHDQHESLLPCLFYLVKCHDFNLWVSAGIFSTGHCLALRCACAATERVARQMWSRWCLRQWRHVDQCPDGKCVWHKVEQWHERHVGTWWERISDSVDACPEMHSAHKQKSQPLGDEVFPTK